MGISKTSFTAQGSFHKLQNGIFLLIFVIWLTPTSALVQKMLVAGGHVQRVWQMW